MKRRSVFAALVVFALLTVGLSAQVVLAQTGTTPASGAGTNVVTLAAGQSAAIPANFWCLDFGKPFPTGITGPSGTAPAKVVSVLQAAKTAGAVSSDPYQTQLAVWYAADGTWRDTGSGGHALAQQLVNTAASDTATPAAASQSLGTLMSKGGLTVVAQNFQAVSDNAGGTPAFHGTGNIMVTNTSGQSVSFVLDGAVFQPTTAGAQTLFAQTANTPQIVAAATTAPTAAPTKAPTAAPTVAPAVASTVAPTAAPTKAPTIVAAATPATLPTTGAADSNGWMLVLLLLGGLTLFAGFKLATRHAQR